VRSLLLIVAGICCLAFASVAHAAECAEANGGRDVTCTRRGYDALVAAVLDERERADTAEVTLKASKADCAAMQAALEKALLARPTPTDPVRPAAAYAAGVFGSALIAASPLVHSPSAQTSMAVVGLLLVGAGFSFVIP
jgi:hypothetical protein